MLISTTAGTAATLADFGHQNMKVNGRAALGVRPAVIILLDQANTGTFSHPGSYYTDLVFNPNNTTAAGVRSVNGFLLANSHGRFSLAPAGGIIGPVQLSASDRMAAQSNDVMKVGLAINAAALAGFNFAPFDSDDNGLVTTDELLIIIFDNSSTADSGAARAANPNGLNPDDTLSPFTPPGSSVSMLMNAIFLTQNVSFATLCHELCHLLGAKDLYGVSGNCDSGLYTLMSCTITNPDDTFTYHLDAWHKMQLGWVEPRIREIGASVVETITATQSPTVTDAPVILYDPAHGTDEFFLLEYRTDQSPWGTVYEDDLRSNGLCIWHVVHDGTQNLIEFTDVGQSIWIEGQPLLGRTRNSMGAWTSGSKTPSLSWNDGTVLPVRIGVVPFNAGDGTLTFETFGPATFEFTGTQSAGDLGYEILAGTTTVQHASPGVPSVILRSAGQSYLFSDSATAATATFIVDGGPGNGGRMGVLEFIASSTASAATITNRAGVLGPNFDELLPNPVDGFGGVTRFNGSAGAAAANFTNEGELNFGGSGGSTQFAGLSSADQGVFTNNGAAAGVQFASGGATFFTGESTAGFGTFTNHPGGAGSTEYGGGHTQFFDTSTAGAATFTNKGATPPQGTFTAVAAGFTIFNDESTAGHGTFINEAGPSSGLNQRGATKFRGNSSAADGTFTNQPGFSRGGTVEFYDDSTAGNGTFTNVDGASVALYGGEIIFRNRAKAGTGLFSNEDLAGGYIRFFDSASADHAEFVLENSDYNDSRIEFYGNSTAANATVTAGFGRTLMLFGESATAGSASITFGGNIRYSENSTAGNANIRLLGTKVSGGSAASLEFTGAATAGNATISVEGAIVDAGTGARGAEVVFASGGSAGSATFMVYSGTNGGLGGKVSFRRFGVGAQSKFIFSPGGRLDVADTWLDGGISVGSIEGTGTITLGSSALAVGNTNTSTTFSGAIADGDSGSGGQLKKVGTGTLTLAGANTHTGLTTIEAGALSVTGSLAGPALVKSGATLQGSGNVAGIVTVENGGIVSPGTSPGTLTVGGLVLANTSILEFELGATSDLIIVNGDLTLDGVVNIADAGGMVDGHDYELFRWTGTLTNNGLTIGTVPAGFVAGDFAFGFANGRAYVAAAPGSGPTPPPINTQPVATSATVGGTAQFTTSASGAGLTYQWQRKAAGTSTWTNLANGGAYAGATSDTLVVTTSADMNGDEFRVIVSAPDGGSSTSSTATLTVNTPPSLLSQPTSRTAVIGSDVTFSVTASGTNPLSYQWRRNGANLAGGTSATLTLANVQPGNAGTYTCVVTNVAGSATSNPATLTLDSTPRIINVSCRASAGAGDSTLVMGFYISGTGAKTLLIRGIGPELATYNVPNHVLDPSITVYDSAGVEFATNNDWNPSLAADFTRVGAFPLANGSKDAAFKVTLAPGLYTVHLVNNAAVAQGVIEVYDFSRDSGTRLTNVSSRLNMNPGENVILGTAVIAGSRSVLARAVGPGIAPYLNPPDPNAVVQDPHLRAYSGQTEIGVNDDWALATRTYFGPTGAFDLPDGSKDAALRVVATPGEFTIHATGKTGGGIALIEIYESP